MIRAAALALALLATPLAAQQPAPEPAPAVQQPPVDPARLAVAMRIGRKVLPDGSYRKLMAGMGDRMGSMMTAQAFDVSLRDMAKAFGMTDADRSKLGPGTIREILAILDPAFVERQRIAMTTIFNGMAEQMVAFEPSLREGMAEAYARRFDMTQLLEIERFFATPTGTAYAAEALQIANDPGVAARTQAMMPAIMKQMPALIAKVTAATAGLPKPRKAADLTIAQCREVARLLGIAADSTDNRVCDAPKAQPKT
jgi:hypothetical protein